MLGFFPGVRRLERDVDHSSPSSAEKNDWSYSPASHVHLHVVDRHRFTFTVLIRRYRTEPELPTVLLNKEKINKELW